MNAPLDLLAVVRRTVPPEPWAEGDNLPWNDPAFSERMLAEHLSQAHDLASRTLTVIDQHVAWLHEEGLAARPGRVLDLACGPGLYAHRLARRGHRVVGIDFSPASIAHARQQADAEALDCRFTEADIRDADFGEGFDLALLIYGQLNVFPRPLAVDILQRAHAALAPGGTLVLEPQTHDAIRGDSGAATSWSAAERGLFSDGPHLLLHERFWDEARGCSTERWHVIDAASGEVRRHALTNEAYTPGELTAVLTAAGFADVEILPGLPGTPPGAGLFAARARRQVHLSPRGDV